MIEFLSEYGLFLAKAITIVIAILAVVGGIVGLSSRHKGDALKLDVKRINDRFDDMNLALKRTVLGAKSFKKALKKAEKERKHKEKSDEAESSRIFVLDFDGDIKATGVSSLREEITALLTFATPDDEILVRLDNAGGLVHEHGLAASQLKRIRDRNIPLTVAVDKVAASGGYMMACIADRIIAAPFAIVGSIGVLAQIPNFHKLLDKHGVAMEQFKAGQFKRTVTMFGENSPEDREKMQEELEETHQLFKQFVAEHRPVVDIDKIATGEHWYGSQALGLKLVDEIQTSDDFLLSRSKDHDLYSVKYAGKKSLGEKLAGILGESSEKLMLNWWKQNENSKWG